MKKAGLVIGILLALVAITSVVVILEDSFYYQVLKGAEVKEHYGFDLSTPILGKPGSRQEFLVISSVTSDGMFAKAGISKGAVVRGLGKTEMLRVLHSAMKRGEPVAIAFCDHVPDTDPMSRPVYTRLIKAPPVSE